MSAVSITDNGFVVDAAILAAAFGMDAAEVPERLRNGTITSRCETGTDEDAGRWRLTFFHESTALRLTVDHEGQVLSRATFPVARRP